LDGIAVLERSFAMMMIAALVFVGLMILLILGTTGTLIMAAVEGRKSQDFAEEIVRH
jgi:hypothetical protein